MKNSFDLEFCFKGTRKYVQGPDIFDIVVKHLKIEFDELIKIKYTAYKMLHYNARLYLTDVFIKSEYTTINSLITFMSNGTKYYAVVCELKKNIECSIDYSEKVIETDSIIYNNTISYHNTLDYTFTEIVVSMNKYFLNQTFVGVGKWIVTKFDYVNLEDIINIKDKEIKIELIQNLNNKLTKSALYLSDKKVGYLYFTLIEKDF